VAFESARTAEQVANLRQALESNRRIGVAIGVLMARRSVTEQAAFDLLRAASQNQHRKLREVADDVVYTGDLDGH
jgi:AmiR/NasT family two-component response regulator